MQLINSTIYDQRTQQRVRSMEDTLKTKELQKNTRERAELDTHFQRLTVQSPLTPRALGAQVNSHVQEIEINNVRFKVVDGGSKLIRVSSEFFPLEESTIFNVSCR